MERPQTVAEADVLCQRCRNAGPADGERKTFYVHLNDGEIVSVPGVVHLKVTSTAIVFRRPARPDVVYPRSRVYYACDQKDCAPASQ